MIKLLADEKEWRDLLQAAHPCHVTKDGQLVAMACAFDPTACIMRLDRDTRALGPAASSDKAKCATGCCPIFCCLASAVSWNVLLKLDPHCNVEV